ncbi:MAG: nicotinate-nucleotide--dimethylbenzimidazole phosphoribosyltransferase, partial [Pseudomonadota bacterium]
MKYLVGLGQTPYRKTMQTSAASERFSHARLSEIINQKTKPLGALGKIEDIALKIGALKQSYSPVMQHCCAMIFVADHSIAAEGVSAYPQAVTLQMLRNLLAGGAAANVFARSVGAQCVIVDAGVIGGETEAHPDLIRCNMGPGTHSSLSGPAMTSEACLQSIKHGAALAAAQTCDAFCFGEMGIGNTASASLLLHKTYDIALPELIGRGTGLDDAGLAQKADICQRAASRTASRLDPKQALYEYGGYEIAMMVGAMMGAARNKKVVLVDGFIATAAAALAAQIEPSAADAFIYTHVSAETGHRAALNALGAEALFDLSLRLGEGTGALLAWPLIKAAADMLRDMASFESAAV